MGRLSQLTQQLYVSRFDFSGADPDDLNDEHGLDLDECFLIQFYFAKLLSLEEIEGTLVTMIHEINEAAAMAIVDSDTDGLMENPVWTILGRRIDYFPDRDISQLMRRR